MTSKECLPINGSLPVFPVFSWSPPQCQLLTHLPIGGFKGSTGFKPPPSWLLIPTTLAGWSRLQPGLLQPPVGWRLTHLHLYPSDVSRAQDLCVQLHTDQLPSPQGPPQATQTWLMIFLPKVSTSLNPQFMVNKRLPLQSLKLYPWLSSTSLSPSQGIITPHHVYLSHTASPHSPAVFHWDDQSSLLTCTLGSNSTSPLISSLHSSSRVTILKRYWYCPGACSLTTMAPTATRTHR